MAVAVDIEPQAERIGADTPRTEQALHQRVRRAQKIALRTGAVDHPRGARRYRFRLTARQPSDGQRVGFDRDLRDLARAEMELPRRDQRIDPVGNLG